jgi:hypothetical protein
MNWYIKIAKKKKIKIRKRKVIDPYVIDPEKGLMYRTDKGLMIADNEDEDELTGEVEDESVESNKRLRKKKKDITPPFPR